MRKTSIGSKDRIPLILNLSNTHPKHIGLGFRREFYKAGEVIYNSWQDRQNAVQNCAVSHLVNPSGNKSMKPGPQL